MPQRTFRVMSYNVRYFGHALGGLASTMGPKRRIAAALLALEPLPDIICLQEVETISLRSRVAHRPANGSETQLEAFMGRLEEAFVAASRPMPYEAFYFRAHAYRFRSTPLYTTGLAVLVNAKRLRIDQHNVAEPQHITHHHLRRWKDRKQSRICAHMKLGADGGRVLHVFNTHLSLPTPWSRAFWARGGKMGFGPNQLHEAKSLAEFVHKHAGAEPFVLCGDFNSTPGSPVYRYLTEEAGFVGAQECLGHVDPVRPSAFSTAGFMRLRMHLDHIFSGGALRWTDAECTAPFGVGSGPFVGLSDHVPLIGRFRVEG